MPTTDRGTPGRLVLPGVAFPIAVFAVWRVAHLVVTAVAGADLVDSAFRWDGQAYRRIFTSGYELNPGEVRPVTAFFPLVAWLAKVPDLILPSTAAMVVTANFLALLAFVAVWGAARQWADEPVARGSVVLLALWPASLFYWAFYSEAGFVAASAGAVWAVRRDRRILAAVLFAATAMARSFGVGVAAVIVGVRIASRRRVDLIDALYSAAALAGLGVVMLVQHRQAGDWLGFVHAQGDWGRELSFPWVAVREGIGALKSGQPRLAKWLDLGGVVAMGLAVLWALWPWVRPADRDRPGRGSGHRAPRLPIEAPLLTVVIVGFPLCTKLLSSMNRYVVAAWPGFVIGAAWLATTRPRVRILVYAVLGVASVWLARYWADGEFIG